MQEPPTEPLPKPRGGGRGKLIAGVVVVVAVVVGVVAAVFLIYKPSGTTPGGTETLSAPTLETVGTAGTTSDTTPYLNWSSVSGASYYEVQVDDSSLFSSPVIDTTASSSYHYCTTLSTGTYHWRVRAVDSGGNYSSWSTGSFIISEPGEGEGEGEGVTTCSYCNGTGNCSACGGDGAVTCDFQSLLRPTTVRCDGKGWYPCIMCNNVFPNEPSDSFTASDGKCWTCGGDGIFGGTACFSCDGTGNCEYCGGDGKDTCSDCNGTGSETCTSCTPDGSGNCSHCGGDGII